jgi:hypothetical protein
LIRRLVLALVATALPLLAVATAAVSTGAPPAAASSPVAAYWLVASDGGIFSFGGAPFYGSTGSIVLNKPIVGMSAVGNASSPTNGGGYWLVAADGGIFSYGDARFYGSTGGMTLNQPVVGMASTPDGKGYWLVAADGGIFSYGDAQFYGSTGSIVLNKPIVGMIANPNGSGYFLLASDGGVFSYNAPFFGSLGGLPVKHPVVAGAASPDGGGYWFTDSVGLVSNFGDAHYYGSAPSPLNRPIVGMADAPGSGSFVGGTYPAGAYGNDISYAQCGNLPAGDHQIGIVQVGQVNGASLTNPNPCLTQEVAWAGGGLNLYVYLGYGTSSTDEPGCNGDVACNAGYQAGLAAYSDASGAGVGSTSIPWWLDVETYDANWSGDLSENAQYVQGVLNALHETEGIPDVGIYASPGVWNDIVGNYQPDVPYWMADYLPSPSGPGSCADITRWQPPTGSALLPSGPLEVVQYFSVPVPGSPGNYDDDYAC